MLSRFVVGVPLAASSLSYSMFKQPGSLSDPGIKWGWYNITSLEFLNDAKVFEILLHLLVVYPSSNTYGLDG